jgi:hypothetical protein
VTEKRNRRERQHKCCRFAFVCTSRALSTKSVRAHARVRIGVEIGSTSALRMLSRGESNGDSLLFVCSQGTQTKLLLRLQGVTTGQRRVGTTYEFVTTTRSLCDSGCLRRSQPKWRSVRGYANCPIARFLEARRVLFVCVSKLAAGYRLLPGTGDGRSLFTQTKFVLRLQRLTTGPREVGTVYEWRARLFRTIVATDNSCWHSKELLAGGAEWVSLEACA